MYQQSWLLCLHCIVFKLSILGTTSHTYFTLTNWYAAHFYLKHHMDAFGSAVTPVCRTTCSTLTRWLAGCILNHLQVILSSASSAVQEKVTMLICFHADCIKWPVGHNCCAGTLLCSCHAMVDVMSTVMIHFCGGRSETWTRLHCFAFTFDSTLASVGTLLQVFACVGKTQSSFYFGNTPASFCMRWKTQSSFYF